MVSEWEAGRVGRSRSGFQWGEEKPASFPTTQHSRSDHCGSFPTCCAVQEAGTRHTTLTPRGLQTGYRSTCRCPWQSTTLPPQPTPHRHHLHRQQKLQDFQSVFFFFFKHQNIPPYLNIRQAAEFGCPEKSSLRRGEGGLLPPGKLAYLKPTRQPSPHHTHKYTHTLELLRLF